jgi:hypothetical protein
VDSFLAKARMKKATHNTLAVQDNLALLESPSQHHPVKHLSQILF